MSKKIKIAILILIIIAFLGLIYFFVREDEKTSLTVMEKKWIEKNKNSVIDLSVLNGIPIINNNGKGMMFDFLNSLEKDTGLDFNRLSYKSGDKVSAEYALEVSDNVSDNILFYQDNYVIITKEKIHFNDVSEIKNLNLAVTSKNLESAKKYLLGSSNVNLKSYASESEALTDLNGGVIDGAILPKLNYLETILDKNLNIAYNMTEYKINYILKLGSNDKLNVILKKYFNNYMKSKYQKSLDKYLADSYFTFKKIDEKKQSEFRGKRYSYGFVLDAPYEVTSNGSLNGFDYLLIKNFSKMANVEVDFKRYSSIKNEVNDFNSNNLDVISSNVSYEKFKMDVYKSASAYNNKVAIVTSKNTSIDVNNINFLKDYKVLVVSDSKISSILKRNGIKIKGYNNIKDLVDNAKDDSIIAIDDYSYDYYIRSELKNYSKLNTLDFDNDYGFIMRDTKSNKIFNEFLNFYITFIDTDSLIQANYSDILSSNNNIVILQTVLSGLIIILISVSLILIYRLYKRRKRFDFRLSKADKLRYIDVLTSLKNRNYLNDNISNWDNSDVYPKSVIIVDLNNVAYINDNFGHDEGDKVISQAAGILINNQLSDSEILRTNGNEFLVFTIGHDEKTIVTYIRKLNKEFKELSHGFGATIGYSMINDEIKTVDDAINEATIDMRSNKEEIS